MDEGVDSDYSGVSDLARKEKKEGYINDVLSSILKSEGRQKG